MSYFLWSELDQDWNLTDEFWIISQIIGSAHHRGGPQEWYSNYQHLEKDEKRKVIRLIMNRNNIKFEQSRPINENYKVTVEDIKSLVEDFLEQKKKMIVEIRDITIDTDDTEWS